MGKSSETTADRVSVKLEKGKEKPMREAVALIMAHYGPLLESWCRLTPEQRVKAIEHCPVIAPILQALGV